MSLESHYLRQTHEGGWSYSTLIKLLIFGALLINLLPYLLSQHVTSAPSEVASRLSSSGVPFHDFYRNISSACAVTVVIFGH